MKQVWLSFTLVAILIAGGLFVAKRFQLSNSIETGTQTKPAKGGETVKLESSAFKEGQTIPAKYTCDGDDVNPPLSISAVPQDAKSLALIVDDPDAPAGDWVHWLMWNIDPKTESISADSLPSGATQGRNDFGNNGYGGPCPPSGSHRYQFKLYALDTSLNLPISTTKKDLESAMKDHILSQTQLTGTYSRQTKG